MEGIRGRAAVVVGGSGGIGAHVSRALARLGATLTVHGGHGSKKFDALMEELRSEHGKDSARAVVQEIPARSAGLPDKSALMEAIRGCEILCVCFGPFLQKPLHQTSAREWAETALLNYALPGSLVSAALPAMMERRWGRIVLFGGTRTDTINGFRTNAAYAGAKTGVASLAKSVAAGYAQHGITCNAVMPGFTETEYQTQEQLDLLARRMPLGRNVPPEAVAKAVAMLVTTPEINGVSLPVDFGWQP